MEWLNEGAAHSVDADPQELPEDGGFDSLGQEEEEFDVPCTTVRVSAGLCQTWEGHNAGSSHC